ncbi:hypothetical protein CTI12_AA310490 [Artemisia annua]|uniref:KIB1-4 beta-propeller domain-containing protein n=1 Tax=Artemisia annua TaxID=35608 RepID=A0A2U1N3Z0_ARTAN|nr:hypothetical protein CTI12_AA310490 [Artemisia annua]
MMEWSEMLPEVLDIIAQKYITCYEDYPSFAGVCKSWRLAAARTHHNSNGPPSRLPSLMLADKSDDQESRELFLLSNKSIRKIQLPEAYGKVCKSSCGWLLTVGKDFASQLINPLSREIINLPKADTFPVAIHPLNWDIAIHKVVLLMESKLVLVIYGCYEKLGFCHIGDNKWSSIEQHECILDITFYNGHIYCLELNRVIRACNVNGKDPTVLVRVARIPELVYDQYVFSAYIVGLDDGERKQLLVIIKEGIYHEGGGPEPYTKSFQVLAYDLETGGWSKVKDFGTKTLFVGYSSSFWIEDTTGVIKGNCIYYTDDFVGIDEFADGQEGGGKDMGIYHLSDGTIEPHFAGESLSRVTPPIWLQSM